MVQGLYNFLLPLQLVSRLILVLHLYAYYYRRGMIRLVSWVSVPRTAAFCINKSHSVGVILCDPPGPKFVGPWISLDARSISPWYNIILPCRRIVVCLPGLTGMIRPYGFAGSCVRSCTSGQYRHSRSGCFRQSL
jgi:hypothetical protein